MSVAIKPDIFMEFKVDKHHSSKEAVTYPEHSSDVTLEYRQRLLRVEKKLVWALVKGQDWVFRGRVTLR